VPEAISRGGPSAGEDGLAMEGDSEGGGSEMGSATSITELANR